MNLLAKCIIYPHLISDDIPELGLIYVKILPITTLLVVVKSKTGLVLPRVEAHIETKTIVGVTNKVSILIDRQAIDTHVACFSTLFTSHSGIDHFEMIKAWLLKLLHRKINLGVEHVHLFKLVNLVGVGLSALLIPDLVRGHLLNQFMSFLNTKSEERTSNNNINMFPG
jgi:cation transporter-like permease